MNVETARWWVAHITPPPQSFSIRGFDRGGCNFTTLSEAVGGAPDCGKVWASSIGNEHKIPLNDHTK